MRYSILFAIILSVAPVAFADSVVVCLEEISKVFHYRESVGDKISDVYVLMDQIDSVKVTKPKGDGDQRSTMEIFTKESATKHAHRLVFDTPEVAEKVAKNLLFVLSLKDGEGYGETEQAYLLGAGDGSLLVNGYRLNWQNDICPFLQAEFGAGQPQVERMARNVVECNHDGRFVIAKCGVNEFYPPSNDPLMQFEKFEYWIFDTSIPVSSKEAIHGPYSLEVFTHNRKLLGVKQGVELRNVIEFK